MKKFVSLIASTVLTVSSLTVVSASAVESNELSITATPVTSNIVADDGTVIPAGVVALTVNINNNYGFDSSATKLDVGMFADVVVNESGRPVVTKGDVLNDFIIASALNNGTIVVSSASDNNTNADGEMFTIYVADNYSGVNIEDITNEVISTEIGNTVTTLSTRYTYCIGDVDNDGYINSSDSSQLLYAISQFKDSYPDAEFTVDFANDHISDYFSFIRCAEVADTNKDDKIRKADANNILQFYTYISAGYTKEEAYIELSTEEDNYCGEQIIFIER